MGRTCIFCLRRGVTKEHVIPEWVSSVLPEGEVTLEISGHSGTVATWTTHSAIDLQVRVVCSRCNTGWMSDLESACKPILRPPIEGREAQWNTAEQTQIASWASKTAMMFGYAGRPKHEALRGRARSLFKHRRAPGDTQVFVAARSNPTPLVWAHTRPLRFVPPPGPPAKVFDGELDTIAIGHLVLQTFIVPFAKYAAITPVGNNGSYVAQVWPVTAASVSWPTPLALADADELELFARRLDHEPPSEESHS